MKVQLTSKNSVQDPRLRDDIITIQDTINRQQEVLDLDSRTSDPTGFETTTGKIRMWFRRDLQELRYVDNGTTYKIAAVAA